MPIIYAQPNIQVFNRYSSVETTPATLETTGWTENQNIGNFSVIFGTCGPKTAGLGDSDSSNLTEWGVTDTKPGLEVGPSSWSPNPGYNPNIVRPAGDVYAAFRIDTPLSPGFLYGWVKWNLDYGISGMETKFTFVDYAYENTGQSIRLGAVPEPSEGLLLLSAFVVFLAWRWCSRRFAW